MTDTDLTTIITDCTAFMKDLCATAGKHHHECEGTIDLPSIGALCFAIKVLAYPSGNGGACVTWWEEGDEEDGSVGSPVFTSERADDLKAMLARIYEQEEDLALADWDDAASTLAAIFDEYGSMR